MADQQRSDAEQRFELTPGQFPFASHFLSVDGARLHYVDEGSGAALFMVHGNPTWSFLYRHLIKALRDKYRCVAVDLPGFGLSDPPPGFGFCPEEHAAVIAGFLGKLDLKNATLIAHDWGGPIGLSAMRQTDKRITRLCLGNTWAWPVNGDFHFEWFSRLMGGPFGRFGAEHFALFVNGIMPTAMRRRKLSKDEMRAYRAPFAAGRSRRPMHVFPEQILGARLWLADLEEWVSTFGGPVHFIWPERDIAFREKELSHWRSLLPQASLTRVHSCGHFLWEDAPEDCLRDLQGWLQSIGN